MPDRKIRAVLFDLGETLIDFGRINTTALFRRGAKLSYEFLRSLDQPVSGFKLYFLRNLMHLRWQHLLSNVTGRDFDALALLQKVGTRKGIRLSAEQWRRFAWLWYEPLSNVGKTEPGIKQTLAELRDSGLKLGIISNTFVNKHSLDGHLQRLGILEFFEVRVYSYEFAFRKPDIRIFKIAAERIGESWRNILYVGDRIDKDIRPALKTGMYPVLKDAYTNAGKRTPRGAARISKISDLPDLIKKISTVGAREQAAF